MIRKSLCRLLLLSLVISCAIAVDDKEKVEESDEVKKEDEKTSEKTVSKRGVFHYSTHGHAHPAIVSATHYNLPSTIRINYRQVPHVHAAAPHLHSVPHVHAAAPHLHSVPHVHAEVPHLHSVPHVHAAVPHVHAVPHIHQVPNVHQGVPHFHASVPHVHTPQVVAAAPAIPQYHISPGGASVTSYSVNYPRYPLNQIAPAYAPAFAPPVYASASPAAFIPAQHHHHHQPSPAFVPHYHPAPIAPSIPHYHTPTYVASKPLIPVAVPVPGIRYPKYPVFVNQPRPVISGFQPQYVPFATPTPTFVPIPVPSNPQPSAGMGQDSNLFPATQEFPQIHMPTPPTFVQPTMPTSTSNGWRPVMMMTHNHRPQSTRPTFTNKYPPYNYHAPAMPLNHEPPSSSNIISGHGQMSGQLAQQLAHYQQHQQYVQQQENSFRYPEQAETFQQSYDPASNAGQYQGLSSYQVPIQK